MLYADTEIRRHLVREPHAELEREDRSRQAGRRAWTLIVLVCIGMAFAAIPAPVWAASSARPSPGCETLQSANRTPVAGYPVRVAYVIPSDGRDRLDEVAPTIRSDAAAIDSWWREQDPTRTIRFDLVPFACEPQLEISSLRLPHTGRELADPGLSSTTIANALPSLNSKAAYAKYLVYYDGPVDDSGVCGAGGNPDEGPGYAIVFLSACAPFVPSATVAVHELLHALGAVALAAPNSCPFPNHSHTCDSEQDIMFPYVGGATLAARLLDPGRDDYYGHSGAWLDVRDSPWLVRLGRQVALSVRVAGSGYVASDVPGLACAQSCATSWNAGTTLTLTPRPAAGMRFVGWRGACSGASACRLTLAQAVSAAATFAPLRLRQRA